jgi:pimeloyl-ACP methyl ester carboxylesterase
VLRTATVPRGQLLWNLTKILATVGPDSGNVKALWADLEQGGTTAFDALTKQYRDVSRIFPMIQGAPVIVVRFFEVYGEGAGSTLPDRVSSNLFADMTAPLRALAERGEITPRPLELSSDLGRIDTEVFLLGGRWDATIPYLEMVAAAERIPHAKLAILNTTHLFAGNRPCAFGLMKAFLTGKDPAERLAAGDCDVWTTIGFDKKAR